MPILFTLHHYNEKMKPFFLLFDLLSVSSIKDQPYKAGRASQSWGNVFKMSISTWQNSIPDCSKAGIGYPGGEQSQIIGKPAWVSYVGLLSKSVVLYPIVNALKYSIRMGTWWFPAIPAATLMAHHSQPMKAGAGHGFSQGFLNKNHNK